MERLPSPILEHILSYLVSGSKTDRLHAMLVQKSWLTQARKAFYPVKTLCYASTTGNLALVREILSDSRVNPGVPGSTELRGRRLRGPLNPRSPLLPWKTESSSSEEDSTSSEDIYAIHLASRKGHLDVVQELLRDSRVDPSVEDNYAIRVASYYGHVDVVRELLKWKRTKSSGFSELTKSSGFGEPMKSSSAGSRDKRVDPAAMRNEAIRVASSQGRLEVVQVLLKDPRVDPSAEKNEAIQEASWNGYVDVVRVLLKDPRVNPAINNNLALRWAKKFGHPKVVQELLKDPRVSAMERYRAMRRARKAQT